MDDIVRLEHVNQYNITVGQETLHPLVSIIDFTKAKALGSTLDFSNVKPDQFIRVSFGFYAIFLKDANCGDIRYGKKNYDYQDGTLVFMAPGQIFGVKKNTGASSPGGKALIFHPDLIHGTALGRNISDYTFFDYETSEALHISERERKIVLESLEKIAYELEQRIDKHSKKLIVNTIQLFLDYCIRFYERQFTTREMANKGIVEKFENLLNDYFKSEQPKVNGLPSVAYFADKLNLSTGYFGDLVKKETGKTALDFIHLKLINLAKEKIFDTSKSFSEIAYELGFKYPQHFTRLFKNETGYTPNEYRIRN
jgi:AraC family transcriptional regulator, transcriptional activator of pobA